MRAFAFFVGLLACILKDSVVTARTPSFRDVDRFEIIGAESFAWLCNYFDGFQKECEAMKRANKLKFSRTASSHVLFSLAVFSLTLVGFSAIAYAVSIPAVLTSPFEVAPVADSFFNSDQETSETSESYADASSPDALEITNGSSAVSEGGTLGLSPLIGGPAFSSIQSILGDSSGSGSDSTSQGPTDSVALPDNPGGYPSQPGGSAGSSSTSDALPPEVEEEIHAHLVACYADLEPYYNEVCEGFEHLYSTMNSTDPNITHASCAPTDAAALLHKCDQARIRVSSYRYNGNYVLNKSKWYDQAQKLSTCFNDLTNSCSTMRTVNGFLKQNAPGILRPHLNSNGEVRYLAECRSRAATIKL